MSTIAQERAEAGYALDADEGEAFWLLGMLQTIKIGKDDTAGRYGLLEIVVPEGVGSPWHVHPEEDEWFYVLEGEIELTCGEQTVTAAAGDFVAEQITLFHIHRQLGGEGGRVPVGVEGVQLHGVQVAFQN